MQKFDIIILGAGIAGASVGAHLSKARRVAILDMEDRAGYHTTSRSAAMYEPNYGPSAILALTRASDAFFRNPPAGFTDARLVTPRSSLFFMPDSQEREAETLLSKSTGLEEISAAQAREIFPILRDGYARRTFLDAHTADMDVDLLHRGYLKVFKANGGALVLSAGATELEYKDGLWHIPTAQNAFTAPIIINAAGAWGDEVAIKAGAAPIGLIPKRRSIGVIPAPNQNRIMDWPMVTDVGETWYSKPQSGKLIVSSADATPVDPHDAYADDMAIAEGIERMMVATTIEVDRLEHSWGGLRTFAPDGNPVIGFDPHVEGFFWLVGQGGYGIQSAPGLSETAAAIVLGQKVPAAVIDAGLDLADISRQRLQS